MRIFAVAFQVGNGVGDGAFQAALRQAEATEGEGELGWP
jgi:hypothetical protein